MASTDRTRRELEMEELQQLSHRIAYLEAFVGSPHQAPAALQAPSDPLEDHDETENDPQDPHEIESRTMSVLEKLLVVQRVFFAEIQKRKDFSDLVRLYTTLLPTLESSDSLSAAISSDSLPLAVKAELLLASYDDLERAAQTLQEIDREKGVLDMSDFEMRLPQLSPKVAPLEVAHIQQEEAVGKLRERVDVLAEGYGELVTCLNDLFVYYHEALTEMERTVAEKEREIRLREA